MANGHHRQTRTARAACRSLTFEHRPALKSARSTASGACACEAFALMSTSGERSATELACETFDEVSATFWASGVKWVLSAQEIAVRFASQRIGRTFWRGRAWMRSALSASWSCWSTACGAAPVAFRCRKARRARSAMSDVFAGFDPQHTCQHCLATHEAAPSHSRR
eukprot:3129397-Prymnesium_polylepis.2